MKHRFLKLLLFIIIILGIGVNAYAQQFSISVLIKSSYFGAKSGYTSIIKDTVFNGGDWNFSIKKDIVNQFAKVKEIKIKFIPNHKSYLLNESVYRLNKMQIFSENFLLSLDTTSYQADDTVFTYFSNLAAKIKENLGEGINQTKIFKTGTDSSKPMFCVYFYEDSVLLPETLTDRSEIEKELDVLTYMSVELFKVGSDTNSYSVVYSISGGQKQ